MIDARCRILPALTQGAAGGWLSKGMFEETNGTYITRFRIDMFGGALLPAGNDPSARLAFNPLAVRAIDQLLHILAFAREKPCGVFSTKCEFRGQKAG